MFLCLKKLISLSHDSLKEEDLKEVKDFGYAGVMICINGTGSADESKVMQDGRVGGAMRVLMKGKKCMFTRSLHDGVFVPILMEM